MFFQQVTAWLAIVCLQSYLAYSLEVVIRGQLPHPQFLTKAVYDGDDSVYILGGGAYEGQDALGQVLQYSLTTEEVVEVAQFPIQVKYGTAQIDSDGNIFYIGGMDAYSQMYSTIWKLSRDDRTPTEVANMPTSVCYAGSASDGGDGLYVIGGFNEITYTPYIIKFNTTSNEINEVAALGAYVDIYESVMIYDDVYIFDASFFSDNDASLIIRRFNPEAGEVEILPTQLPHRWRQFSVVAQSENIYIIGGTSPGGNRNELAKFNSITQTIESVAVTGFPSGIESTGSVYVPKLDRIYIFGGFDNALSADILGIDLASK